jgi:L-alanine-DL-glutamate epimerase-like enolase superfamily enzyme
MKIARIETFPVKLALRKPFIIASIANYWMFYVIVKVTTDSGVVGYGEAIPAWEVTGETQFSVIDAIGHLCEPAKTGITLMGKDVGTLDAVLELLRLINPSDKPAPICGAPSAKAALEQALLDAHGKHVQRSVHELFNGTPREVRFNRVIGILPIEETLSAVEEELTHAHPDKVIKLKVGIRSFGGLNDYERDVQVIRESRRLCQRHGQGTRLVADANQGFVDAPTTLSVLKRVEGCLDWLEQPILADDKLGFKRIKDSSDTKLMADESVHNSHDARLLLELRAVDYINIKLMKTGGMIEALKIAELAEGYGIPCQVGSMLENKLGTAMLLHTFYCHKNLKTIEAGFFGEIVDPIGEGISITERKVILTPSARGGHGISLNDDAILPKLIVRQDSALMNNIVFGAN